MKTIKTLLSFSLIMTFFTSCYVEEVVVVDEYQPTISLNQLLGSHELWYVDVNRTVGYGETPFLQKAFTISFINGGIYANNNIVGIGNNGNGFGIKIGNYDAYDMILDTYHVLGNVDSFDVFQINDNTIELYNPNNDTSYFLEGYDRNNFDYDFVFYDNIHYFLQEYDAWEKTYTSDFGAVNAFDDENYMQFLSGGNDSEYRSSIDASGTYVNNLQWDYTGLYAIENINGNDKLKNLVLDYDGSGNEYFELTVINDGKIELYHPLSETVYEFVGRGYIEYLKSDKTKEQVKADENKMRKHRKDKQDNPRESKRIK